MAVRMRAVAFHGIRVLLGAVFLYASYDKILHPRAFAEAVYNYQILPDAAVNVTALVLPWLELLLGACLMAGFWLPGATVLGAGLLTLFMAALIYNQARGLDVHCGCFSTDSGAGPAGLGSVVRDFLFWSAALYLTARVFWAREEKRDMTDRMGSTT